MSGIFGGSAEDRFFEKQLDRHTDGPEVDEDTVADFAAARVDAALADGAPLARVGTEQRREQLLALAEEVSAIWTAYEAGDLDAEAMEEAKASADEAAACDAEDLADGVAP
jgi:hypothetical protein